MFGTTLTILDHRSTKIHEDKNQSSPRTHQCQTPPATLPFMQLLLFNIVAAVALLVPAPFCCSCEFPEYAFRV